MEAHLLRVLLLPREEVLLGLALWTLMERLWVHLRRGTHHPRRVLKHLVRQAEGAFLIYIVG